VTLKYKHYTTKDTNRTKRASALTVYLYMYKKVVPRNRKNKRKEVRGMIEE